jgi:type VI protein secretion system component VasK
LETASNRSSDSFEADFEKFASAVADIQLLGTPKQVKLAKTFALEFAQNGTASLDELTENLRNSLREELQLEVVSDPIVYLRLGKGKTHIRPAQT